MLETWFVKGSKFNLTKNMLFAWKALFYKVFEVLECNLFPGQERESEDNTIRDLRRRLSELREPIVEKPAIPDNWIERSVISISKIYKCK